MVPCQVYLYDVVYKHDVNNQFDVNNLLNFMYISYCKNGNDCAWAVLSWFGTKENELEALA